MEQPWTPKGTRPPCAGSVLIVDDDPRNRETGGFGLGLAVVCSIARAHGGGAVLVNGLEGGLVCRVRLPLRPER